jgi:hypothetical protein
MEAKYCISVFTSVDVVVVSKYFEKCALEKYCAGI